jgi:hypothetical protein
MSKIPEKWRELYEEVDGDRRPYAEAIHILIGEVAAQAEEIERLKAQVAALTKPVCKHKWVCGLDQQQCMEECGKNHDPNHLICKICKRQKNDIDAEAARVAEAQKGQNDLRKV